MYFQNLKHLDSERGNFKLFGLIYYRSSLESLNFFGARFLKKREPRTIGQKSQTLNSLDLSMSEDGLIVTWGAQGAGGDSAAVRERLEEAAFKAEPEKSDKEP